MSVLSLAGLCLYAQPQSAITISTNPSGARFSVDGQVYIQAQTFVWPKGSKHLLVFILDPVLPNQPANTSIQTSVDGNATWSFGGWLDNAGLLLPSSDAIQTITADPRITTIKATLTASYRVQLVFFNSGANDSVSPPSCGAPGAIPAGQLRPGVVFLGSQCFWNSANVFVPAGSALTLNAFPYPGFVFIGWSSNIGSPDAFLRTLTINSPITLVPQFAPGKRIRFLTAPPFGLQVLVDRTPVPTRTIESDLGGPCPSSESQPVNPNLGFPPMCLGDFDFAAGSTHIISAASPQIDTSGKFWVFDSWSNGLGLNGAYVTDSNVANADNLIAKFVPGAHVAFLTSPGGLKLTVDGRPNFASYDFVWGLGTTHTVSAPANQFDAAGRQYTFKSWSNSGGQSQSYTVDQSAVDNGYRMTATFGVLSRVLVQSSPSGLLVQVDGASCTTPCTIDRSNGTKLRVTAPTTLSLGDSARMEFTSWSDNGDSDHTFTVNTDFSVVTANYRTSYRLSAASDPGNGVNFKFDPATSDMFYPQDTQVTVAANANPGFKFRRWDGDLTGTYPVGVVMMSTPHAVVARLDKVPFIAPAGVRNAVGDTPNSTVAPGSIISIFGESLAPVLEVGRVNPLAQSIAGVTVTVNDRILPLLYVSPSQINAQVPSGLGDGDYTLQVHNSGQDDISATFSVARNSPGLFFQTVNSQQYALALHDDGSVVTPDNPARPGETLSLLGTGFGPYNGLVIDGFFPPNPAPAVADSVNLSTGDQVTSTMWSGAAPGYTGLTLTKFKVPDSMQSGATVPVKVTVNGADSNTVMVPIQ
ncbi:MAG TPA: hypothetical protein VIX89_12180 [Bryobacteraceae bacterium]